MAKLIYSALMSVDGYISDEQGNFDWAAPDEEVHQYFNDHERDVGTHLYGRRLYETMVYWETADTLPESSEIELDYARVWKAADKVVYSRTLETVSSERTRIEREFDHDAVRRMKAESERDISIGGAELAGQALVAGLVDELHVFATPVLVGGGARALPDSARLNLELLGERRFGNGTVHLHYRVVGPLG